MKDLIERQAAIDALKDWYDGMIISSFRGIEKVIKALPSAQPESLTETEIIICKMFLENMPDVSKTCNEYKILMDLLDGKRIAQPEIVRCKDCKFANSLKIGIVCRNMSHSVTENDFCSRAERRTDD